jgi:hypothetical protein
MNWLSPGTVEYNGGAFKYPHGYRIVFDARTGVAMSLSPVQLRNQSIPHETRVVLEHALNDARRHLRTRHLLRAALASLPAVVLACALWIVLIRYTFAEVPPWAGLLFVAAWVVGLVILRSRIDVPMGEAARYLDSALGLDERVSTSVELIRSGPVSRLRGSRPMPESLLGDAAHHLNLTLGNLPSPWRFNARRRQLLLPPVLVMAMLAAILLPTPLDAIRAERAQLDAVARAELERVAAFKGQIVERDGLTNAAKEQLLAELSRLEAAISSARGDRSALLAALNDAQERLQELAPGSLSEFDGLLAAARTVQLATVNAVRNSSPEDVADWAWNPADYPELSDLAKAADAADVLNTRIARMSSQQIRASSPALERASSQAASADTDLGQDLMDSARSIAVKDAERGAQALKSVSARFRAADGRFQMASSVEQLMAGLDGGRQNLAQTGTAAEKRNQVGFRRSGTAAASGPGPTATNGSASDSDQVPDTGSVSLEDPSALGPKMGSNSPSYQGQPTDGPGGAPAAGVSGSGGSGSQATQPGQDGAGGSPGGTAGGGQSDQQGTLSGQPTGPVGGGGGAISQVPNPAGRGAASSSSQDQSSGSPAGGGETLYLPQDELADGAEGNPRNSASNEPSSREGIQGRVSGAGDGPTAEGSRGPGSRVQVRVPYREVLGQYAEQATRVLDQVYIPSDAKEYVKQYFTELGR